MSDQIRAGDPSPLLPSTAFALTGAAAFVLRPTDLDRLPVLTEYPTPGSAGEQITRLRRFVANLKAEPGPGREARRIATSIEDLILGERVDDDEAGDLDAHPPAPDDLVTAAVVAPDEDEDRFDENLLANLRGLGNTYGPLGVGIAAASLTDPRVLAASITDTSPRDPRPEPVEDARSQIDRLAGYIAYNVPGEPSRSEGAVDCAIRLLGDYLRRRAEWDSRSAEGRQQVARLVETNDELRQQLAEFRASLPGPMTATDADALLRLREERDRARRALELTQNDLATVTDERDDARRQVVEAGRATTTVVNIAPRPPVPAGEVNRPHPAANAWPDNAVTITYAELRALIALHLDTLSRTLGKVSPWEDARRTARAMRDGEAPLLLSEVLDR